jgi:two-component system sensor histidine kinase UhpB
VAISAIFINWNGKPATLNFLSDITDRKQAEKTLKESEERYRSLVDNAHEAIYVAQDGMIKFINRAGVEIAEQSEQELISRPFIELIHPDDRAMAGERYLKRLKGEVLKSRYIFRIITKNDNIKWLEVGSALINFEGRPATLNVVTDITDRKQVEEELRISRSQLRALATRLQQIREEERLMVAREIHDEMGGGLTGLKMDLSWLLRKMGDADPCEERVALMDKIHTSNALIDQMIKVVRRISADLRPSVLDDLGLIAALSWQAQEFTSRTEIQCEFVTHIDYINLEDETATGVFRVFQEALTNVMRHSQATKVAVVLREDERSLFGDESLVLEIRDNGRGITEEEILNPESLGLLGMKERVLAFRGELRIFGEPGGGTVLVLKIPRIQGEPS